MGQEFDWAQQANSSFICVWVLNQKAWHPWRRLHKKTYSSHLGIAGAVNGGSVPGHIHISIGALRHTHGRWLSSEGQLPNTEREPQGCHMTFMTWSQKPCSLVSTTTAHQKQVGKMIPYSKGSKTDPSSSWEALENPEEEKERL